MVCAVDDAHLLDSESLDALAFVARRLEAESVAMVFAARDEPDLDAPDGGVPRLDLAGLEPEAAVRLLLPALPEPIDPAAAAQIAAATGGNPLALIDLAGELTARGSPSRASPTSRSRSGTTSRRTTCDRCGPRADVQQWLLLAAADSTGNLDLIRGRRRRSASGRRPGDGAEAAGWSSSDRTVRFRHPAGRSAVYNAAPGADRRRVHAALAAGGRGARAGRARSLARREGHAGHGPGGRRPARARRRPGRRGAAASPRGPACWRRRPR